MLCIGYMLITRQLQVSFSLFLHGLYANTYIANMTVLGNGSKFEKNNKIPPYSILFLSNLCPVFLVLLPLRDLFCFVLFLAFPSANNIRLIQAQIIKIQYLVLFPLVFTISFIRFSIDSIVASVLSLGKLNMVLQTLTQNCSQLSLVMFCSIASDDNCLLTR